MHTYIYQHPFVEFYFLEKAKTMEDAYTNIRCNYPDKQTYFKNQEELNKYLNKHKIKKVYIIN